LFGFIVVLIQFLHLLSKVIPLFDVALVPHSSLNFKYYTLCLLLQVRKKLDGFFECYPDAQTACTAYPEKMAAYLAPLGLQHSKTYKIQKMSKAYVEEEWTYITELFGVDK
jgi:methyl-CpG-binding domain protein 4